MGGYQILVDWEQLKVLRSCRLEVVIDRWNMQQIQNCWINPGFFSSSSENFARVGGDRMVQAPWALKFNIFASPTRKI
jgi:hypothetical protein